MLGTEPKGKAIITRNPEVSRGDTDQARNTEIIENVVYMDMDLVVLCHSHTRLRFLGIRDLEDDNSILAEPTPLVVNILLNVLCCSFLQLKLFDIDFASAQEIVFD